MQELINVLSYIIVSIGGTGVLILGLAGFVGKIWVNKFAEEYRAKYEKEIEKYKSEMDSRLNKLDKIEEKALYISKVNYDTENKIYLEIWPKLIECINYTINLYPKGIEDVPVDEEEKEKYKEDKYHKYVQYYNDFSNCIEKYAPFYLEDLYNIFKEIRTKCFEIGNKYKMYEFDVKYNMSFVGSRDLQMNTDERIKLNQIQDDIIKLKNDALLRIRKYLEELKLVE